MSEKIYSPSEICNIALRCPVGKESFWEAEVNSAGQVSDGYHTFNELYEHRCVLFCCLSFALQGHEFTWKSRNHWVNGSLEQVWPEWFLAGISFELELFGEKKQITYHLPIVLWDSFFGEELTAPPDYDGHTPADVVNRMKEYLKSK